MATSNRAAARAIQSLLDLGFREIEAKVYTYLLAHPPTTGYRVSHAIGKPVANTYKAIAELERRGAIQVDDGGNRLVRAVPIEELLAQIERAHRDRRQAAEEALTDLEPQEADDRIYSLRSVDQVLERARAMVERARRTIVADLFPQPFRELRAGLVEAAGRGLLVAVKVYERVEGTPGTQEPATQESAKPESAKRKSAKQGPAEQESARQIRPGRLDLVGATDPARVLDAWPGQQLSIVCDAEEHLLALLSAEMDTVHQAVWSRSAFLSCMHHNHVAVEIAHTRMRAKASRAAPDPALLLVSCPPGLSILQKRYAAGRRSSTPGTAASLDPSPSRAPAGTSRTKSTKADSPLAGGDR